MVHTILYFGPFLQNFRILGPETTTYLDRHGESKPVDKVSSKVDGLHFRYMERPSKQFLAVGVGELVMLNPVLLIPERHTDGKGFFSPPQFGDDAASNLLVDMILSNPDQRDTLATLIRQIAC